MSSWTRLHWCISVFQDLIINYQIPLLAIPDLHRDRRVWLFPNGGIIAGCHPASTIPGWQPGLTDITISILLPVNNRQNFFTEIHTLYTKLKLAQTHQYNNIRIYQLLAPARPQSPPAREYLLCKYFTNSSTHTLSILTLTKIPIHQFTNLRIYEFTLSHLLRGFF